MSKNKLSHFFRKFDLFGQPVGLNFRGKASYQTTFGAAVSVISILLVLFYAIFSLEKLYSPDGQSTFVASTVTIREKETSESDEPKVLDKQEIGFQFGVAWFDTQTWKAKPYDPRYGIFKFTSVHRKGGANNAETKQLQYGPCTDDQFKFNDEINDLEIKDVERLENFVCPDPSSLPFKGSYADANHSYLQLNIEHCN